MPGPFNCQVFEFVGKHTAGMKAATRIAFGRLGAEYGSLGFQNRSGGMILGCNQIQGILDPGFFLLDNSGNFGVIIG